MTAFRLCLSKETTKGCYTDTGDQESVGKVGEKIPEQSPYHWAETKITSTNAKMIWTKYKEHVFDAKVVKEFTRSLVP